MKRSRLAATLCAALPSLLLAAAVRPLRAAEPFYLELLRDGEHAYDRGDWALATRSLRLACFGLLDDPKALGACLTRLALAQDKSGDVTEFRETFRRLSELEDRFQAYSQADLPPELRNALTQRLAVRIPQATLDSSPAAFRSQSARKPPQAPVPSPSPAKPQTAKPGVAKGSAPGPRPAPAQPSSGGTASPPPAASPAAKPASDPQPAEPQPVSAEERTKLDTARQQLAQTGNSQELNRAFQLAHEVADAHPDSIEAQRLAGEAAYRISHWSDAVTYLQRGNLPDSEPELLFYLAVSLYESGNRPSAADVLRRSLPNLQRSAYVDAYARKILGR